MSKNGTADVKKIIKQLSEQGWIIQIRKHYICDHPKGGRVVMSMSPSYQRAIVNIQSDIKRIRRQHGEIIL